MAIRQTRIQKIYPTQKKKGNENHKDKEQMGEIRKQIPRWQIKPKHTKNYLKANEYI